MMENPYMAMVKAVQAANVGKSITTESLDDYGLGNVDCPICGNTGHILREEAGSIYSRECPCMNKRRSLRRIANSGMSDLLERYTFASYETRGAEFDKIYRSAIRFSNDDAGWFFIAGQSGSGKTHICTAICNRLIEREKNVYYMSWRDESRKLKAIINSDEADEPLRKLKTVSVLYIDDFLKGGYSDADVRLAFEILNSRYNNSALRTIISSEIPLNKLFDIDEAMAGRIYERAICLKAPDENWRLKR